MSRLELLEQSVSKRASGIEESMLKGLRTISEKAAAALAQKLPIEARLLLLQAVVVVSQI